MLALLAAVFMAALLTPGTFLLLSIIGAGLAFFSYGPRGASAAIVFIITTGPTVLHTGSHVLQERSFFGVYTVLDELGSRALISGTTIHGTQILTQGYDPRPTVYYHQAGPIGQVVRAVQPKRVAVIGLGIGTLADYGRPGDDYVFFEIDQLVVNLASDPELFGFLDDGAGASWWVAIVAAGSSPSWASEPAFRPLDGTGPRWTDDYSNVLGTFRF